MLSLKSGNGTAMKFSNGASSSLPYLEATFQDCSLKNTLDLKAFEIWYEVGLKQLSFRSAPILLYSRFIRIRNSGQHIAWHHHTN